jgi:nucleoid DNA-binding protein
MEQLIKLVTEKVGISETQAKQSVETVMGFLKDKMPAGIGSQVESFMKNQSTSNSNDTGDGLVDKLNNLLRNKK